MKILIIEDEKKIANSLKKGLTQQSHTVDVCYNGVTGYDLASTEDYDVIILDLMLPLINGEDLCEKLRKDGIPTPILMLTAKDQIEDKISGLNLGADDYLTKPFSFDELVARTHALARRPKPMRNDILSCDNLKMDLTSKRVFRGKKEIKLSKREFALLEYLLKNINLTLSKEQIIEHVWSFDDDILPNTVEVYIRYLRNKIDKPFKKILIKTVRGFGYTLSEK